MSEQSVIVQKISWQDLCPWTLIFKTLPVASSVTVLVFALLGVLLTPMGWLLSQTLFLHDAQRADDVLMRTTELNASPYRSVFPESDQPVGAIEILGSQFSGPRMVFEQLVRPFRLLFDGTRGGWEFCYFLLGNTWSILVWSFVGLAITRVCLLRLTRNEHFGLDDAFEFAMEKWLTTAGAIGIPLAAVAVLCIPTFLIGLFMGFDIGVMLVGVFWFIVLLLAIAMSLLLLGLMFGWPLMVASVAAESQNSFDAMTRSYAYTFQRPLHYAFYMLIAILFGGFCWMIVGTLTQGVVQMAYWSTSWGTGLYGSDRIDVIQGYLPGPANLPTPPALATAVDGGNTEVMVSGSKSLEVGRGLIGLWNAFVKTLAAAFIYGLFWCQAAAIYLLLRKDVDETEMDEIYVADEKRTYELPPLKSDASGIPQVQSLVAVEETQ